MGLWEYLLDWLRRCAARAAASLLPGARRRGARGAACRRRRRLFQTARRADSAAAPRAVAPPPRSLFFKEEMELSLIGLNNAGKTSLVNVVAVRADGGGARPPRSGRRFCAWAPRPARPRPAAPRRSAARLCLPEWQRARRDTPRRTGLRRRTGMRGGAHARPLLARAHALRRRAPSART